MRGLLSLIIGGLSFAIIVGSQLQAYQASELLLVRLENEDALVSNFYHWSTRMIVVSGALVAISFSINCTRSGQQKMNIVNRVGRYLAVLAIILSIIPVYQIFLK